VLEACQEALAAGHTRDTDSRGLRELRDAIARDKGDRAGQPVDPDQVLVTSGTSPAMLMVFARLLERGGEVIVPTPHYPCYPNFVHFCGGTPVFLPTRASDGWAIDPDAVRRCITPHTRALVVGSPANPTGAVQSAESWQALAELGVPIVADEIYDGLVYPGGAAPSALATRGAEVTVLDGFSKRYAMTGFRLGYAVAPLAAMRTLQTLQQNLFISAADFVQRAGLAALASGASFVAEQRALYQGRRDRLVAGLRALGFGIPTPPAGALYVFADARAFGADSRALVGTLLERAHVAVTPGIDFGEAGEGFLRFCFAVSEEALDEGLERLAPVLAELRGS
jgi:aspartate aminotransferase